MYKIVGEGNRVNYGSIDELVEWNYEDFKLYNFFDKEIKGLKKKFAYHKFNYIGILSKDYLIGFATVDLGYGYNVFSFLYGYDEAEKMMFSFDKKGAFKSKVLEFPDDPDNYKISFRDKKNSLTIFKSHNDGVLNFSGDFGGKLKFEAFMDYSIDKNHPLRVLNPSQPTRWTFTEKFSPLIPNSISVSFNGKDLGFTSKNTHIIYDWSGGYLRRETNWYWASMGGALSDKKKIGANFAALVNETYFSENAFWINKKRTRVARLIFDFDRSNPYEPWHIYSEYKLVDLVFSPIGERQDKVNLGVLGKSHFRQFFGSFSGWFSPDGKKASRVVVKELKGFCEMHRAIW